jgi:hypothetical protein
LALAQTLRGLQPTGRSARALGEAHRHLPSRRALVFLVSDFHLPLEQIDTVLNSLADPALGQQSRAMDFYNNDLYNICDNFFESDGGYANIRMLRNRCFNSLAAPLSIQPVYAGPVYWIRNVVYNSHQGKQAFKLDVALLVQAADAINLVEGAVDQVVIGNWLHLLVGEDAAELPSPGLGEAGAGAAARGKEETAVP